MKTTIYSIALTLLVLGGCAKSEEAAATTTGTTEAGTSAAATTEEKSKCAGCGTEVVKAELADHDGKMMCKACIASHNH